MAITVSTRRSLRLLLAVALCAGVLGSTAPVSSASELDPAKLGMYVGFDRGDRFTRFERELGTPIRYVVTMADSSSPSAMMSSVWGQFARDEAYLPTVANRVEVIVSIPLAFGPGGMGTTDSGQSTIRQNLLATAAGRLDDEFRTAARYLKDAGYGDAIIRLGHEFDSDWSPYSARNNDDAYIAAFRHVHDVLESESSAFRFEWTSMRAHFIQYGPPAYPGDAYVDIIGLDIYWRDAAAITDEQWNNRMKNVLVAHQAFAVSKGKPVSYPEWGRSFADHSRFIDLMHDWFSGLPAIGAGGLLYQSYFNEPGNTGSYDPYNLDLLPNVKRRYIQLFGRTGGPESPATPTTVVAPPVTAPVTTQPSTPPVTLRPVTTAPVTTPPSTPPVTTPPSTPPVTTPPSTAPVTTPPSTSPVTVPPSSPPVTAPPITSPPGASVPVSVGEVLSLTNLDVCGLVDRPVINQVMGTDPDERTGALPESYGPSCIFTSDVGIGVQFHRSGPGALANIATTRGQALVDLDVAGRRAQSSDFSVASKQLIVWLGGDTDPALVVYAPTVDGAVTVAQAMLAKIAA